jgi:hypothetical protein
MYKNRKTSGCLGMAVGEMGSDIQRIWVSSEGQKCSRIVMVAQFCEFVKVVELCNLNA